MYNSGGLIPSRFLILISHFVLCVDLLWSQKDHSQFCLPLRIMENQASLRSQYQIEFLTGISVALAMICLETLLFLLGLTMFNSTSALLSIVCHSSASVLLTYFIFDGWQCGWFWWIVGAGSIPPILYDICTVLNVLYKKKY